MFFDDMDLTCYAREQNAEVEVRCRTAISLMSPTSVKQLSTVQSLVVKGLFIPEFIQVRHLSIQQCELTD